MPIAQRASFLIASTDGTTADALGGILFGAGFNGKRVASAAEALSALDDGSFDVVIADHSLASVPGGSFPAALAERGLELPVVVLVSSDGAAEGVAAVRAGAADFLRKPVERDEVLYVLKKALEVGEIDSSEPPRSIAIMPTTRLIGSSRPMQELESTLRRAANGTATVLVRGESGTGKELVARLVHELSPRRTGRRRPALWLLTAAARRRSASAGSAATGSASKATHCSHVRRKPAQHSILLDDDGEWTFLFQVVDLDLAGRRINSSNNSADCAETSSHDFLRIEVQRICRAFTERA